LLTQIILKGKNMKIKNVCLVLETGTDVRLVESLAKRFNLSIIHRQTGFAFISQPTSAKLEMIAGPASRVKFARFVISYLKHNENKFDYVISQNYGLSALAANIASRITNVPTSMLVCSPAEAYYQCRKSTSISGKSFRWSELLAIRTIAIANALVGQHYFVLSKHLADVVTQYGIRKPTTFLPLYGVDTTLFKPANIAKTELKEKMGLPTTGKLIFFSSRIAPEKDSETLLASFRKLIDEGQDIWLLHRSGGYKTFLKDAEKYGINHRIIATDAVHPHKGLPLDYQACDLCIQSSRQEGLGFSPLEALACETPVIASAIGGLRETITPATGWSYLVGDISTLTNCIREVITNPKEAQKRAKVGRKMVQQTYDSTLVFNQLLDLVIKASALKTSLNPVVEVASDDLTGMNYENPLLSKRLPDIATKSSNTSSITTTTPSTPVSDPPLITQSKS
jgi:glycosyltransferase involved in cell wall biosynthesis